MCDKDIHNNKEMIILNKQQVTRAIEKVLSSSKIGVLSTAHHNKPNSRYMVFYNDDLNLYTKTNINSLKVEEIENNPDAHILLGYNETTNNSFVEIDATIEVVKDQKLLIGYGKLKTKHFSIQKKIQNYVYSKLYRVQLN